MNPHILRHLISLLLAFSGPFAFSQQGTPMFRVIPPEDYESQDYVSSPQNLDIIRSDAGLMYVATATGILEYDGVGWRNIPIPDDQPILRLEYVPGIGIAAFGFDEIGYLAVDSLGLMQYNSVRSQLLESEQSISYINRTELVRSELYFIVNPSGRLYRWNQNGIELANDSRMTRLFQAGGQLYSTDSIALYQLEKGQVSQQFNLSGINSSNVVGVLPREEGLHVLTRSNGIYLVTPTIAAAPVGSDLDDLRIEIAVCEPLNDGSYALGTLADGLIVIDSSYAVVSRFSKDIGLQDNRIIAVYQDVANHKLWLGTQRGCAILNYPISLSLYDESRGLDGIITSLAFQRERIYVGSYDGLYRLDNLSGQMERIWEGGSTYDLKSTEGGLLLGSSAGLFEYSQGRMTQISESRCLKFAQGTAMPGIHAAILRDRIAVFQDSPESASWTEINSIEFSGATVTATVAWQDPNTLWVSADRLERLEFEKGLDQPPVVTILDSLRGLNPDWNLVEVSEIGGEIYFGTPAGVYELNGEDSLVSSPLLGSGMSEFSGEIVNLTMGDDDRIWFTSDKINGYVNSGSASGWQKEQFVEIPNNIQTWRIYPTSGTTWFCTTRGLYRYEGRQLLPGSPRFNAIIREVYNTGDSIVNLGFFPNSLDSVLLQDDSQVPRFPYSSNDIAFQVAGTSYNLNERLEYSFRLLPLNSEWSSFSKESRKEYNFLPAGSFEFQVRARNIYGQESGIGSYRFAISPPWYRTWTAYLLYALGLAALILVAYRAIRASLEKRQREELRLQNEEIEREKSISRKLRQLDNLKDDFLAQTSHELRTPLTGIIGIAESLQDGIAGDTNSRMSSNLDLIINSGRRLENLVNGILDYSKLKTHNIDLQLTAIDLRSLTEVVIRILQHQIGAKEITIRNEISHDLPPVMADEARLEQVLFNLVGNALKFTREGEVVVNAHAENGFMQIAVRDTGIGIPEDKLESIFESYEQVVLDGVRPASGTGLGLTICRQLIELHGGAITAESSLGEGTTISFSIPLADESEQTATRRPVIRAEADDAKTEAPDTEIETPKSRAEILVVDDEVVNRNVLTNQLELHGYHVTAVDNGLDAISSIKSGAQYDLILLDLMMPKVSGFEVCEEIRKDFLPNELPIILITAKNEIEDLVKGFSFGANDYITKPFSKDELLARVKTHLNLAKITQSYRRFLPQEFFHYLKKDSVLDIRLGDQQEHEVTVLFCDIRQYTTLAESMTPQENFDFLNAYHGRIGPIIREQRGFVGQYAGDGILALFLEKPGDAVVAARLMQKRIAEYNAERQELNRSPVKIGIGIHTGPLIMGILGDDKRMDVTVVADSVNTASRMEGLTKFYGADILISDSTFEHLSKDKFDTRFLGRVQVKGKQEAVGVHEVLHHHGGNTDARKLMSRNEFDSALQAYFARDFTSAASGFRKTLEKNADDLVSKHYLELSENLGETGVEAGWDGILFMSEK